MFELVHFGEQVKSNDAICVWMEGAREDTDGQPTNDSP